MNFPTAEIISPDPAEDRPRCRGHHRGHRATVGYREPKNVGLRREVSAIQRAADEALKRIAARSSVSLVVTRVASQKGGA